MLKIKTKFLVLGKNCVKLNDTTIQAEDEIKANCTIPVLSLHFNGDNRQWRQFIR